MEGRILILYSLIIIIDTVCTASRIVPKLRSTSYENENGDEEHIDDRNNKENDQEDPDSGNKDDQDKINKGNDSEDNNTDDEIDMGEDKIEGEEHQDIKYENTGISTEEEEEEEENRLHKLSGSRPLAVGDTFTPSEMLPIARKLIAKVENPGGGKGIVSSSKSDQDLADKLFHGFFQSPKRIVTLEEYDIVGIDALQALALSGDVASLRNTENPEKQVTVSFKGQTIAMSNEPKAAKYTLVTKDMPKYEPNKTRRQGIKLAQKLLKNRDLVINSRRKYLKSNENTHKGTTVKENKKSNDNVTENNGTCHWRYECKNPGDLDTCTVQTTCMKMNHTKSITDSVNHQADEHSAALKSLRKMLGISIIDEEVEKILESRIVYLRPQNLESSERIDGLSDYFRKIVMTAHESGMTTSMPQSAKH